MRPVEPVLAAHGGRRIGQQVAAQFETSEAKPVTGGEWLSTLARVSLRAALSGIQQRHDVDEML